MEFRNKIKNILNCKYERMFPHEIEKEIADFLKNQDEKLNDEIKKEIFWEIDLLNRTFGRKGTYEGEEVEEISNKWGYYLESNSQNFMKPFSNIPFCEWDKEAINYYKQRYAVVSTSLSKARYSFAIMVFSTGKEKFEWMKKSVKNWIKTAEDYIEGEVYNEDYYEIPIFSYEFALRIASSFNCDELEKDALSSLHKNLIQTISSEDSSWYHEYSDTEAKYINQINGFEKEKQESIKIIKKIIKKIEENDNPPFTLLRRYIDILISYEVNELFYWEKKIADSYISEANSRDEPMVKSSFLSDAIKCYKKIQNSQLDAEQKKEIDEKIDKLTLEIKESSKNIEYKTFGSEITIKKEDIKNIIKELGCEDIFHKILDHDFLIPNYQNITKSTEGDKISNPFGFMVPIVISKKDFPILKYSSEDQILDYRVRHNILIGIKINSVMLEMTLDELKNECGVNSLDEIQKIISDTPEIEDISEIIERGFTYIFGDQKDYIAGIHIIIPYFEEIIRRMLVKAGKKDIILEEKEEKYFRKILLGGLLENKSIKELIGENFQHSLRILLTDNDQFNLRQDLAHGFLTSKLIKKEDVLYSAYCLLKLIKILKQDFKT